MERGKGCQKDDNERLASHLVKENYGVKQRHNCGKKKVAECVKYAPHDRRVFIT